MFQIFKNLLNNNAQRNERYYEKIKKLSKLVKDVEQQTEEIWWQNVINTVRVTIWIENNLTTINIRIVEGTSYEFSLNFSTHKYKFVETTYDSKRSPHFKYLDIFEENIEIIFLDTIDKTIDYFFNKLQVQENDKYIKQEQDVNKINNLSSSVKSSKQDIIDDLKSTLTLSSQSNEQELQNKIIENESTKESKWDELHRKNIERYKALQQSKNINTNKIVEKLAQDIDNNEPSKKEEILQATIEMQSKTIQELEKSLQSQSKETNNIQKDFQNKLTEQSQYIDKLLLTLEHSKATSELQSEILHDFQNKEASRIQEIHEYKIKYINEYKIQIDAFQKTISSQSNEIVKLQNKLLKKEEDVKELKNNFTSKINTLEEKIKKQKVVKTMTPLYIPVEKQTINKTDGELIKRDSFDDF
jgi:hypothetical protein